jgi:polyferredoxin
MNLQIYDTGLNLMVLFTGFVLWAILISTAIYLISKRKLTFKISILLYIASFLVGGLIIGAVPNPIMPITQLFSVIGLKIPIILVFPMIIFLVLLLLTTLVFGRAFCGFVCPIGAMQELLSKKNFKSSVKTQKSVKSRIDISPRVSNIIRWIFFIIFAINIIFWGYAIVLLISPFTAINLLRYPFTFIAIIPLIALFAIVILSIFIYRPWCRFLCPFGAISGITSRYSFFKFRRTDACTECGLCEEICPTNEASKNSKKGECYYCNRCVEVCPQKAIILGKL